MPKYPEWSDYPRENTTPKEVTVPKPDITNVIETDKEPDGSFVVNTNDIPKDRWTNVINREHERFNPNWLHCLDGYERNERGECVGKL